VDLLCDPGVSRTADRRGEEFRGRLVPRRVPDLLAGIWSYYYERVWHAFFHAAMVGLLAHMLLQLAVMLKPALPFAAESRKIERSSRLYVVLFLGSMMAGVIPVFLPSVYARPPLTAVVVALMLAVTAALEYTLRLRVAEAIGDLEFRA
jgi:uncharacterized membrane protein